MASNAEFSIDGDPFANLGHDAINSEVLTLALEDLPALDVFKTVWEVVQKTDGAPDIAELGAIGGGGAQPTPTPQDTLDITMPAAGTHSYIIRCTINNGVSQATGSPVASFTAERGIAIRNAAGLRKIPPAETTQFDATYGWSASFSEAVDATPATPAVTVDNRVARFDGIAGNVQNTGLSITDADRLDGPAGADLDLNAVTGQAVALQVNAVDVLRVLGANVEVAQRILAAAATDLDLDAPTGQTVNLQVNNTDVLTASGTAITAAQKVTGAAASHLELNAVTGQGVELQINDVAIWTYEADRTTLAIGNRRTVWWEEEKTVIGAFGTSNLTYVMPVAVAGTVGHCQLDFTAVDTDIPTNAWGMWARYHVAVANEGGTLQLVGAGFVLADSLTDLAGGDPALNGITFSGTNTQFQMYAGSGGDTPIRFRVRGISTYQVA